MGRLAWDKTGEHFYETGVKQGVLYVQNSSGLYPKGVAWNGLTSISENPSGAEATAIYADNTKYLNLYSTEEFGATIEAYTYPEEFEQCDGSASLAGGVTLGQQTRSSFGLSYRTEVGNDILADAYGYKIHIIYGCKASPSEKSYQTINDSPEAITFSWEVTTIPVNVDGFKPTSTIVIDTTKVKDSAKIKMIEDILYGIDAAPFDETKEYAVGDYVTHEETVETKTVTKTYKCTTAIETPGEWDANDWTEVTNPDARLPLPDEIATIFADEAA